MYPSETLNLPIKITDIYVQDWPYILLTRIFLSFNKLSFDVHLNCRSHPF